MAFNDNLINRMFAAEVGDGGAWICSETSELMQPGSAADPAATDGTGTYHEAVATGEQYTVSHNLDGGETLAVVFRIVSLQLDSSYIGTGARSYSGVGVRITGHTGNQLKLRFAAGSSYSRIIYLPGPFSVGDVVSLVISHDSAGTLASAGGGCRVWLGGHAHNGNDPDYSDDSANSPGGNNTNTLDMFGTNSRGAYYGYAHWNYRVSDADSRAMVDNLLESIEQRQFTPTTGGPNEDAVTNLPRQEAGTLFSYDVAPNWSASGGGTVTFGNPVNFPAGLTLVGSQIQSDGTIQQGSYSNLTYDATETGGTSPGTTTSTQFSLIVDPAAAFLTVPPSYDSDENPVIGRTASEVRINDAATGAIIATLTNVAQNPDGSWTFTPSGLVSGTRYRYHIAEYTATVGEQYGATGVVEAT